MGGNTMLGILHSFYFLLCSLIWHNPGDHYKLKATSILNTSTITANCKYLEKKYVYSALHRYSYNKVTGYVPVCVHRRFSPNAGPKWFSFTMKLFNCPNKDNNYLGQAYQNPPNRIIWSTSYILLSVHSLNFNYLTYQNPWAGPQERSQTGAVPSGRHRRSHHPSHYQAARTRATVSRQKRSQLICCTSVSCAALCFVCSGTRPEFLIN